jgi:hypothetical protein
MEPPVCPNCGASIPLQGADDEWCEACGKQLPLAVVAAVHAAAKRLRKTQAAAAAAEPSVSDSKPRPRAKRLPGCAVYLFAAAIALVPLAWFAVLPLVFGIVQSPD